MAMMLQLIIAFTCLSFNVKCSWAANKHDYLVLSFINTDNLYALDAANGDTESAELLNLGKAKHAQFRGIQFYNNSLYVSGVDGNKSYIGRWQCKNISVDQTLPFDEYFSKHNKTTNLDGLIDPTEIIIHKTDSVADGFLYTYANTTRSLLLYNSSGKPDINANGLNGNYPGSIASYYLKSNNTSNNKKAVANSGMALNDDLNLLFVSNPYANKIMVYDTNDEFNNVYNISNNVSTFLPNKIEYNGDYYKNVIFVGDTDSNKIYAFNVTKNSYSLYWEASQKNELKKPTGMVVTQNILYVISQKTFSIVQFKPDTGKFIKRLIYFQENYYGEDMIHLKYGQCFIISF